MKNDSWEEPELYRLIFEESAQAIVVLDGDGNVVLKNRAARDLESSTGTSLERLDLVSFREQLHAGERAAVQLEVTAPGGSTHSLAVEGRLFGMHHVLSMQDVTERRRADQELYHLRKLQVLTAMTAAAVHDFNNLLATIICSSAVLAGLTWKNDRARELAHDIRSEAERAASLMRRMARVFRRERSKPERVDVSAVLNEMQSLLELVAGKQVTIALELAPNVTETWVERERLEHVVINLVANARDAMPRGGKLVISTAEAPPVKGDGQRPFVSLTVKDSGDGMAPVQVAAAHSSPSSSLAPEDIEHVFERSFTTTDAERGAALRLETTRSFVEASGGRMSVASVPGRGTTVAVYLPQAW